jgi:hypothetical protein
MKKVMIAVLFTLYVSSVFSTISNDIVKDKRQLSRIERAGGWVIQPSKGKVIRIINTQKKVTRASLEETANQISQVTSFPVIVTDSLEQDPVKLINNDTAAVVIVTESDRKERILIAPENGWSIVNVRAIGLDGADDARVSIRTAKEVWRAAAMMLGASDSMMQPCLLTPIHSIADLDANHCAMPSMEHFNKMINNAKKLGVEVRRKVSYRKACQEGWAPAPTNDIQKAIWDKVHATPKNPMKIEFDPKKGR